MSPANIDDTTGPLGTGAARPLTRKELRAREKSLSTGGQDAVPEQAYETGDVPPPPAAPPAAVPREAEPTFAPLPDAGDVPAAPETPPSDDAGTGEPEWGFASPLLEIATMRHETRSPRLFAS